MQEFNGTQINVTMVKSRTSKVSSQYMMLGFTGTGTSHYLNVNLVRYAKELGLIVGNSPECYLIDAPEFKFDLKTVVKDLDKMPELKKAFIESFTKHCNLLADMSASVQ